MLKEQGFAFSFNPNKCQECGGKCCRGESGYIFVNPKEIEKIAEFLQLDFESFCLKFVKKVGYRYSLIEKREKDGTGYACVFFDEEKMQCGIYPVRPKQCEKFPFWDCYKEDFKDLLKECIGVCQ